MLAEKMSFVVRLVSSSSHGRILALWFCFLEIPLMSNVLFLLYIYCMDFELLDCDVGAALLPKLLVMSILTGCEIELLFLIRGMVERL